MPKRHFGVVVSLSAVAVCAAMGLPPAAAHPVPASYGARCPAGQKPLCPSNDPFYAPPPNLGSLRNGSVIRYRPIVVRPPDGPVVSQAYVVIYKSADAHGHAVADATTILLPATPYVGSGPRPLISYQTAEDSLGRQCAPSYSLATGSNGNISAETGLMQLALDQGWVVAVPDYEGPFEQYGAGVQAAHAVLDGIRAAQRFSPAGLSITTPAAMWGYSGGGLASAWAAELQDGYAPGLRIVGSAEGGVPPDVKAVAKQIDGGVFSGIEFAASEGLSRAYPEAGIVNALNAAGKAVFAAIADECINTYSGQYGFHRFDEYTSRPDLLDSTQFAPLFAANHLEQHPPRIPIYDYHATQDELVPYAGDQHMVDYYCRRHVAVDHVALPVEHVSGAAVGGPGAVDWLRSRFAGSPPPTTCPSSS